MGLLSLIGAAVTAAVVWDVFHTLWHPSGQGRLSHALMAFVWRLTRHLGGRLRRLAGPLAMATVILAWASLVVIGGALVYWPHLPDAFSYGPGLDPGRGSLVVDALYVSMVTVTTLGFGDIVPTTPWLRLVAPLQAMVGFALLTAAVSWVLQVYPALTRRRTLSLRLATLEEAGMLEDLDKLTDVTAARILDDLTASVAQIRVDLTQYTESYFFQESSRDATLAVTIGYAHELALAAEKSDRQDVHLASRRLLKALNDLAQVLDEQFLHTDGSTSEVLAAYSAAQTDR
ncbi:potassium channel family protein [Georgenia sp. SUBG003]|uniref:potassium channel family protein n=1 Tax=Georgenia sp. SUBG003 TaxID=1497974 RepID=UPI0004D5E214|nr:hypothetical protein DA06_10780 [Georgenia sp. SUBG003]